MRNRIKFYLKKDYTFRDHSSDASYEDRITFNLKKGTVVEYKKNSYGHHQIWFNKQLLNAWDKKAQKKIDVRYPDELLELFETCRENNLKLLLDL